SAPEYASIAARFESLDAIDDASLAGVRKKEEAFRSLAESEEYRRAKLEADAWCAAFVWPKTKGGPGAITHDLLERVRRDPTKVPAVTRTGIERVAERYGFFQWHLAFPDVFHVPSDGTSAENKATGWGGGFDVVLGNPPWERIK